jgi:hypothetical protein
VVFRGATERATECGAQAQGESVVVARSTKPRLAFLVTQGPQATAQGKAE